MPIEPNLSKSDVMHILRIGSERATRMLEDGEIPAFKIGKRWQIPNAQFFAWLGDNCTKQARLEYFYSYANEINFKEAMSRYYQFLKERGESGCE